ncbi:MAG TPA: DNA-binding protein [Candidatus Nanoarchaeia archaeon]|nr:DNA-binding protein [Candidatus Nanoarchaeia archaeon]
MKKIILDTNALMAVAEFKLDIFTELERCCDFNYKLYVLSGTIDELRKIIEEQRGRFKRAAKLALDLLKAKKVPIIPTTGSVDDLLVKYSLAGDLILTQDYNLKKRLTKPYLIIRQKNYVVLVK